MTDTIRPFPSKTNRTVWIKPDKDKLPVNVLLLAWLDYEEEGETDVALVYLAERTKQFLDVNGTAVEEFGTVSLVSVVYAPDGKELDLGGAFE